MSLLRFDLHCRGIAIPAEAGGANCRLSRWLACFSLRQPDLSATRSGLDAGVLWTAVFFGADDCGHSGKTGAAAPGSGDSEADLCWIHTVAVDFGRDAVCERQTGFAKKPGLLSDVRCEQIQHEGYCAGEPAIAGAFMAAWTACGTAGCGCG